MAVEFITIDRDTPYMFPPSVQDYLPEDHLSRLCGGDGRPVGFERAVGGVCG